MSYHGARGEGALIKPLTKPYLRPFVQAPDLSTETEVLPLQRLEASSAATGGPRRRGTQAPFFV